MPRISLGARITLGFGSMLIIIGILGLFAIVNIKTITDRAASMAEKYVPQVRTANDIERWAQHAMQKVSDFAATENAEFLKGGKEDLREAGRHLKEAKRLVDAWPDMVDLAQSVTIIEKELAEYSRLVAETARIKGEIVSICRGLDVAALAYMENCYAFLGSQNETFILEIENFSPSAELKQRHLKIGLVNDIIDLGNATRLAAWRAAWRAQLQHDSLMIRGALNNFPQIEEKLAKLRPLIRLDAQLTALDSIAAAARLYGGAMKSLAANWEVLEQLEMLRRGIGARIQQQTQHSALLGIEEAGDFSGDIQKALGGVDLTLKVGLALALLLGATLAYLVTRSIVPPVVRGAQLAGQIAQGDFSGRLQLVRGDEIGQLAESLDSMSECLQKASKLAGTVADGNLNVRVELASDKDQLGQALQKMTDNLNEVLQQVQIAINQMASGAGQLADSSQQLAQGATEQANSLEEVTSAMGELASQTRQNAENADQANRLTKLAQKAAERGDHQVQTMVQTMEEVDSASQDVAKIIKTIDEIAFQTNLLALNAAVEAARAGKFGRGFAVVAEEVRTLAGRSAKAARETAELIKKSTEKTTKGSLVAQKTAMALRDILAGATQASDLVGRIASACDKQAADIAQVNQGLAKIENVTQYNADTAEQSAAAAQELSAQTEHLRRMLGRFSLRSCASKVIEPSSDAPRIAWELEEANQ